jgi:pilus assembly protein CpaF
VFELILPHISPIKHLIQDDTISEVMINDDRSIWIDKAGQLQRIHDILLPEQRLRDAIINIARVLDQDISPEVPILNARLPDGSRVCALVPPASLRGPVLSIRKFLPVNLTTADLVKRGSLPQPVLDQLLQGMEDRENILISGGTTSGKTTLLNALAKHIPAQERIVVIEDTAEIKLEHPNTVRLEAQKAQPGRAAITISQLLETALRLRPDRILVGEVRNAAAYDLLQAMNTGHSGTMTTLHANTANLALTRLASLALRAEQNIDHAALRSEIADVVNLIVQTTQDKLTGRRHVSELVRVEKYNYQTDQFITIPLWKGQQKS